MGFRICYIASEAPPDELIAKLHLTKGETLEEMPDGDWWVAELKSTGWTILWSENEVFGQSVSEKVAELSNDYRTYICEVNETVMWSSAELWSKGRQLWKVAHAGDGSDRYDLTEIGELPEHYADLKKRHFAAQENDGEGVNDVDHVFEVPLDLASAEFGFRHEMYLERDDVDVFNTVVAAPKKSLLSRILGR